MNRTAYQRRLAAIRANTAALVSKRWDHLEHYDEADAHRFPQQAGAIVGAGQLLAARTVNGYLSGLLGVDVMTIHAKEVIGPAARRGVGFDEVYQRPFYVSWHAMSEGEPRDAALSRGRRLLYQLADTDVWLASRTASMLFDSAHAAVTRWVRAADEGACTECAAADGMAMNEAAEMAGHPNCGCTSEPITDPNAEPEASDPEAITIEHDEELGPVLRAVG